MTFGDDDDDREEDSRSEDDSRDTGKQKRDHGSHKVVIAIMLGKRHGKRSMRRSKR